MWGGASPRPAFRTRRTNATGGRRPTTPPTGVAPRGAKRRSEDAARLDTPLDLATEDKLGDYLALDEAIEALRAEDPRLAEIVRLRFFAGLSVAETAALLDVSERTVKGEWAFARAWLARRLASDGAA